MKLVALHHDDQNYALFDPWSVIHMSAGLFFGLVGVGPVLSMTAAVGYDLFEQVAERQPWGQHIFKTSGSETVPNIITDIALFALGWYLGNRYMNTPPKTLNPAPSQLCLIEAV